MGVIGYLSIRCRSSVFSFFFASCLILLVTDTSFAALKVVVDPGHGGVDGGATRGAIREADIALNVGRILQKKLLVKNFEVAMTRSKDQNITLEQRVQAAEDVKGDLLVSLHVNSSPSRVAKGFEIYFQNQLPPDEEMLFLAANEEQVIRAAAETGVELDPSKKNEVKSIIEDLNRHHRMLVSHKLSLSLNHVLSGLSLGHRTEPVFIKQAPFFVITKSKLPSVLVELGFLTNTLNASKLADPIFQAEIAEKITQGLTQYRDELLSGQVKRHSLD
jgi:N-acetylmuramoyl-L-alanine amidase